MLEKGASGAGAWSVDEVAGWAAKLPLDGTGAEALSRKFRDEEVSGSVLLSYAQRDRRELRADFGLSIGKAAAVWDAIYELHREQLPSTASAPPQVAAVD